MNDKELGYFTLQRSLLEHELWLRKPFSWGHAWADLIGRANYKKSEHVYGAQLVSVERGQLVTSLQALAERWGWSRGKVKRFLNVLEMNGMLTLKRTASGTVVSIVNYSKYQLAQPSNGQRTDRNRTENGQRTDSERTHYKKDNKENKENKDNNTLPPASRTFIGADGEEYEEVDHL
ncbi:MAG: hypothetical protein IJG87_02185 [Ruminococcus sp.]|nr:hypothetical protein [Ruminococcus sp.]